MRPVAELRPEEEREPFALIGVLMMLGLKGPCDAAVVTGSRAKPRAHDAAPWILFATILASSMVFIDGSAVNLALPVLQSDLHATNVDAQWVVEAYALLLSALILVGGSLGDHFGRRRIFLWGVIGFAAASALCGAAHSASQLIAARAAQGLASALLTPGSLSILGASFDDRQRSRAIGIWSSFSAMTSAVGPVLGGFIVQHASWRWIFFINIPLAVVTALVTVRCVPESHDDELVHRIDWAGASCATVALGAVVYALISAGASGWTVGIIACFLAGIALAVAFVVVEARVPAPMMPLNMFALRNFGAINAMTLLLYAALVGATFLLPFNLILIQHYSPTAAGAAVLPSVALMFLLSPLVGNLMPSVGAKRLLFVGATITSVALAALAVPGLGGSYWVTFFPSVVALGFGMSLVVTPLTTTVMESVGKDHLGIASGINNAVARTAGLLAIAALSLAVTGAFNRSLDQRLAQISPQTQVVEFVNAQRPKLAAAKAPPFAPKSVREKIEQAIALSYVAGFRLAMLVAAILAACAALCALLFVDGLNRVSHAPGSRSP